MSSYEQFGRLSPPPFYHHSPLTDAPASLSFMLGPPRAQVHQRANSGPPSSSKQPDDMYYIAKYKDMKRKVKEIEFDNDRLHLKCLKTRKNIQRLRLERAILYESLSTMPVAEFNPSSVTSSQLPGAHPYPSPGLVQGHQERHQQRLFSPDGQARIHLDQSCMPSESVQYGRSQHQHPSIQGVDPHRPPHRPYDDCPPIGYQPPGVPMSGTPYPVIKPRQRKSKVDTTVEKNQSFSNTHHEVRNGGSRTFPFVHEYSSAQEQVESVFAPSEYPSEIRFHQYEGLSERRPGNRSKRDGDRDTEKGSKHKRRPPQDIEKDRRIHLQSRSCSPTPLPHGTYAFPIQNPFTSTERESQAYPAQGDEHDRDPNATKTQPVVHLDGSSQHDAESKCFGTRAGDETCIRHEYLAEAEGKKKRDSAWHPLLEKKRVFSQVDHGDRYAKERDESNRTQKRVPRDVVRADDVYSLPRVREGDVMD